MALQRGDVGVGPLLDISAGPSSAIIGAAYMGYMDITFPHGCVYVNMDINILDRDRDLSHSPKPCYILVIFLLL